VPEDVQLILHVCRGRVEVGTVQENWGEEGGGQSVAEVRGEAFPWGGEPLNRVQSALGERQSFAKVGIRGEGRREPVAQPP